MRHEATFSGLLFDITNCMCTTRVVQHWPFADLLVREVVFGTVAIPFHLGLVFVQQLQIPDGWSWYVGQSSAHLN